MICYNLILSSTLDDVDVAHTFELQIGTLQVLTFLPAAVLILTAEGFIKIMSQHSCITAGVLLWHSMNTSTQLISEIRMKD